MKPDAKATTKPREVKILIKLFEVPFILGYIRHHQRLAGKRYLASNALTFGYPEGLNFSRFFTEGDLKDQLAGRGIG